MPTTKSLKEALFETVQKGVTGEGFVLKRSKERFVRERADITDVFQLVCLDGKPGLRVQPNVGVRVARIEETFHRISGFEPKYQGDTVTIGAGIGNITNNDNRACEFIVETDVDVITASEQILRVFREFALPYFARFSELSAIDAELNDHPLERTPNRPVPWLRCASGLIVAKLVERPNYTELVQVYGDLMSRADKGFYLGRFRALADILG